jgi:GTP cyclohydrolase III
VDRITEQSNERIKELDACIERAKVQLWREWTDELGERKEMAIVQVVKLRRRGWRSVSGFGGVR